MRTSLLAQARRSVAFKQMGVKPVTFNGIRSAQAQITVSGWTRGGRLDKASGYVFATASSSEAEDTLELSRSCARSTRRSGRLPDSRAGERRRRRSRGRQTSSRMMIGRLPEAGAP